MNSRSLTLAVAGLALLVTLLPPSTPVRAGHDAAGSSRTGATFLPKRRRYCPRT